jgi:DNA-binding CsgD family transcriptional regulator
VATSLLDAVLPDWPGAAEEPERRGLLEVDATHVHFRHELARHAIRSSVPIAARRRLHRQILDALLATDADPADVVHHAEAAGARDVVADYALVAARRAAALESPREAFSHYRRASDFLDRLPESEQAAVLEELARTAYVVGRLDVGLPAIRRAIAHNTELGAFEAVGRCTRVESRFHWYAGDGRLARAKAVEAIAILEPLGDSVELARALSGLSQLALLEDDLERALVVGERALERAVRLGDDSVRAHALANLGSAKNLLDYRETETLLEAHAVAHASGDREEAMRSLGNLGYTLMVWAQPEPAARYLRQALDYARAHELHNLMPYLALNLAWLRLRAGEWEEVERFALAERERGNNVVSTLAKIVLTELAVRRGDPDAPERLAEVTADAERTEELQRTGPVLELATEWALTTGAPMPVERFQSLAARIRPAGRLAGCRVTRLAAWAAVAGIEVEFHELESPPFSAMVRRDWQGAADAFGAVGWLYDRALMLSLLDAEEPLAEALDIARGFGAEPLVRRVAGRMRELGMRVPHGPRGTTRANPAGLTARQLEVLALLVEGLTNAEIAERLVVSPRTAEHHVAAVLTKLGATTRRDAARRASELGLPART